MENHPSEFSRKLDKFVEKWPKKPLPTQTNSTVEPIPDSGVGAVLQEQDADVGLALDAGLVERRVVPAVRGVGLGAGLEQERDDLGMSE